jgi:hypothetical protein
MKTKKERRGSGARENFYRCPACHEMVDNRDMAAVLVHHGHVLHPRLHLFASLPSGRAPAAAQAWFRGWG